MTGRMPASDQIVLLLALVPYLRDHGPTHIDELASTFNVKPATLKKLVTFLGTAGIPGETLAYQHNDLFDLDWDALEMHDVVSLTHTVAIDETPRFTGAETAALLAGLHALTPMLSEADAATATALAARVATAMNAGSDQAVVVTGEARDATLTTLVHAIETGRIVTFEYRDISGAPSVRTVHPSELTEREHVWYLRGFNVERNAERTFRVPQIDALTLLEAAEGEREEAAPEHLGGEYESVPSAVREPAGQEPAVQNPPVREDQAQERTEIVANLPARLLPAIRGFAPKVIDVAGLPEGSVQVSIEAWHPGAAVRLAQHGPGAIEIIAPPAARAAVSEWAERALLTYGGDASGVKDAAVADGQRASGTGEDKLA